MIKPVKLPFYRTGRDQCLPTQPALIFEPHVRPGKYSREACIIFRYPQKGEVYSREDSIHAGIYTNKTLH